MRAFLASANPKEAEQEEDEEKCKQKRIRPPSELVALQRELASLAAKDKLFEHGLSFKDLAGGT